MEQLRLNFEVTRAILACGADTKGAFALAKGKKAYLFEGFGDLSDPDNLDRYEQAVRKAIRDLKLKPQIIACDLHPGYFSTQFAENYGLRTTDYGLIKIQHHEAHIAAGVVDNRISGKVVGVAFDGTGFGADGNIWGGEFFIGSPRKFARAAHLEYVAMPGGEAAVREPWRMVESYLCNAGKKCKRPLIKTMIDRNINSPLTSSAGRLFDGVGSIVLGIDKVTGEAQIPIELEKIASGSCSEVYGCRISSKNGQLVIGVSDIFKGVMKDMKEKAAKAVISAKFHNTLARIIADVAFRLGKKTGTRNVVLSGGVFLNRYLVAKTVAEIESRGLKAYPHLFLPAGDQCIPIGQIAIANERA